MPTAYDVSGIRDKFPGLAEDQIFLDNAGGSQVLGSVIDSISTYLSKTNVQLGASYKVAKASTDAYNKGVQAAADYVNAAPDEIVIGASTTQLFRNLSISLSASLSPGDELIVSEIDHEANIGSWVQLAAWKDLTLKWWTPRDKRNPRLEPADLQALLSPRTRLVTCTHTSNILGTITDIRAVADAVHTVDGAMLCVDGVALAPHRAIDVKALGADFYAFSWYKVYGPHCSVLYAARAAQDRAMTSLGHFFKEGVTLEDKLGMAGANYECVQAIPQVTEYLAGVGWEGVLEHETQLQGVLLEYLRKKEEEGVVQICGEKESDGKLRVPVISFVVEGCKSEDLVESMTKRTGFGFRWGHFYSKRLMDNVLGLGDDGVVRVSAVHYNTLDEMRDFVKALDQELKTVKPSKS